MSGLGFINDDDDEKVDKKDSAGEKSAEKKESIVESEQKHNDVELDFEILEEKTEKNAVEESPEDDLVELDTIAEIQAKRQQEYKQKIRDEPERFTEDSKSFTDKFKEHLPVIIILPIVSVMFYFYVFRPTGNEQEDQVKTSGNKIPVAEIPEFDDKPTDEKDVQYLLASSENRKRREAELNEKRQREMAEYKKNMAKQDRSGGAMTKEQFNAMSKEDLQKMVKLLLEERKKMVATCGSAPVANASTKKRVPKKRLQTQLQANQNKANQEQTQVTSTGRRIRKSHKGSFYGGGAIGSREDTSVASSSNQKTLIPPGTKFSAELTVGITSQNTGKVLARVSKDVVVNSRLLIPKNSMLSGRLAARGKRIQITFSRVTKPNGKKMSINAFAMQKGTLGLIARVRGGGSGRSRAGEVISDSLKDTARDATQLIPGSGIVGNLAENLGRRGVNEATRDSRGTSRRILSVKQGTKFMVIVGD